MPRSIERALKKRPFFLFAVSRSCVRYLLCRARCSGASAVPCALLACINNDTVLYGNSSTLAVRFLRSSQGKEPVREWLRSFSSIDRKLLGAEIRTVQLGWPIGMPVVRKLDADLWKIRVRMNDGIARELFTIEAKKVILLHGFFKKSQKSPADGLHTAQVRLKQLRDARRR